MNNKNNINFFWIKRIIRIFAISLILITVIILNQFYKQVDISFKIIRDVLLLRAKPVYPMVTIYLESLICIIVFIKCMFLEMKGKNKEKR